MRLSKTCGLRLKDSLDAMTCESETIIDDANDLSEVRGSFGDHLR